VQTVRELMAVFPSLQVEFLPDTGQLLFFREWRRVLDEIAAFLPADAPGGAIPRLRYAHRPPDG
jgi:hypothetical protein